MNKPVLALVLGLSSPIFIFSQALDDYRSANTGNWNAVATWQRFDGPSWVAATATPASANGLVTIQNTHTVTLPAGLTVSIDQVTVNTGSAGRSFIF